MAKQLKWHEKVAGVALLVMLVTNPLIGQYVVMGVDKAFEWLFQNSGYISAVTSGYLIVYGVVRYKLATKVVVKPKNKTKKTPAYLEA